MNKIWRHIDSNLVKRLLDFDVDDIYDVSTNGEVRSSLTFQTIQERLSQNGYTHVPLLEHGCDIRYPKYRPVDDIVGLMFLDIPNDLKEKHIKIHHINGDFSEVSKIKVNDKITSILLLKNGNLLTSSRSKSDFNIYEWGKNENFTNIKSDKLENIDLNKSFNESENYEYDLTPKKSMTTTFKNYSSKKIYDNNSLYEKINSFYTEHKGDINVMVEMSNEMFASGGKDKQIIIWEKVKEENNQNKKKYIIFQKLTKEFQNFSLKDEIRHMIFLYDQRLVSADYSNIYIWYINQNKIENPLGYYSIKQKISFHY